MRRLLASTLTLLALALAGTAAAQPTFVFEGSGWGHGVGLSQWGAYGLAKNGWTHDRILAHYYRGTTIGQAPIKRVRVLLAKGRQSVSVSSEAPFSAVSAGKRIQLPAGTVTLGRDLTIAVDGKEERLQSPVRFQPGTSPLRFDRAYRGAIVVHLVGGSLSVVNDVKLEQYVAAIVPHEMPASWELEALKAQAVAARTYAVIVRRPGTYFDFEHNPVQQAYEGVEEEDPRTNRAVAQTKGEIVLYDGKPAWTFYSSSSGGRTARLTDAFPGGKDLPYLVPVDDPYDSLSPHHRWSVRFGAAELASKLSLPGPVARIQLSHSDSGRVRTLTASGNGWTKEVSGPSVRTLLGLRSTLFTVKRVGDQDATARP